jgi:Secretion system C-terminal sorting domain
MIIKIKNMKKTITILLMCATCFFVNIKAQTYFGADVTIENNALYKQTSVKLASAFNGWLYSAIQYSNAVNDSNGLIVRYSKDKGFTWKTVDGYKVANTSATYDDVEIVVAGTDTNNLQLYLSGIRRNVGTNYVIYIDKYNARNGAFLGSIYNLSGSGRVYDLAMATDYMYPASGTTGYSVGLLYSRFGSVSDSIIYLASVDGGASMSIRQSVAITGLYFRKVSISYGKSASGSNGRYFGAWERLPASTARNGNIYASRSTSTVNGNWITPKNLDSLSSTMIGLCRNPRIMTSSGLMDNDSSSLSAVVLVDRDYLGDGSDYDMLGFWNNRAHFANFWSRLDIVNNSENDMQSDIVYHDSAHTFLATYYDSTNSKLVYVKHDLNFNGNNNSTWTTANAQYNDAAAGPNPFPRLAYNPQEKKVAAAWSSQIGSANAKALFDSDYSLLVSSLVTEKPKSFEISVYPNPAKDFINVKLDLKQASQITMELIDMTGKQIMKHDYGNRSGAQNFRVDFSDLKTGIYMMQLKTDKETVGYKISVEK